MASDGQIGPRQVRISRRCGQDSSGSDAGCADKANVAVFTALAPQDQYRTLKIAPCGLTGKCGRASPEARRGRAAPVDGEAGQFNYETNADVGA